MTNQICESFEWFIDAKDIILENKDPKAVRLKAIWGHANEVSLNNREYIEPELAQFGRTMINHAVNNNHDDNKKIGRVPWSEWNFKEHQGEAIIEITKEPFVGLLRNGSLKPRWSIQANYLRCECSRCHKTFTNEKELKEHIQKDEAGLNASNIPRGMIAAPCCIALVTGEETPGLDTSGEVLAETAQKGFIELCETYLAERVSPQAAQEFSWSLHNHTDKIEVDKNIREMKSMETQKNIAAQPKASLAVGPVPKLFTKESEEPTKPGKPADDEPEAKLCGECHKPLNADGECTNKECSRFKGAKEDKKEDDQYDTGKPDDDKGGKGDKEAEPAAKEVVLREGAKISKFIFKEFVLPNFSSEQVESGQANLIIKEKKELNESFKFVSSAVNEIIEYLSTPLTFNDNTNVFDYKIQWLKQSINRNHKIVTETINALPKDDLTWKVAIQNIPVYNDTELREMIKAIPIYDDKQIKEALSSIPKDDLSWKEAIEKLPKDDITWVTKLTEQDKVFKQLEEKYTQLDTQNKQETAELKKTIGKLEETVSNQKKEWDSAIALADKNNGELRKSLDEMKTKLEDQTKKAEESAKQLQQATETLEKTRTLAENTEHKIKANFKGHSQQLTETDNKPIMRDPITEATH